SFRARSSQSPDQLLRLTNREVLIDDGREDPSLGIRLEAADCATVPLGQASIGDRRLNRRMEIEQPERVRDGRTGTTHPCGEVFLREGEIVDETPIGPRRLDGIEVLALEVLDEGKLELVPIRE